MPRKPPAKDTHRPPGKLPQGRLQRGNVDLTKRPVARNRDGSISTVRSVSFQEDGKEVLVPSVVPRYLRNSRGKVREAGGKVIHGKAIVDQYRRTGEHLGKFDTEKNATKYAESLHEDQAKFYVKRNKK